MRYMECIDTETGEDFNFHLDPAGDTGWEWQGDVLAEWLTNTKAIDLKARQLGITWLAAGLGVWQILYRPGTRVLAVSINEKEAGKLIRRAWTQFQSLPERLRAGVEVVKPGRGAEAGLEIELKHPDGRISTMLGLPSTPKAGHGETAALVILDEFSRQDYARETWKAVLPTASKGGRIVVISTGNGTATPEGDGNFFCYLYKNAHALGMASRFLPWDLHPDRDEDWYARNAMPLLPADRGEQYPRNEREAFILTGTPYFDMESLLEYEDKVATPVWTGIFEEVEPGRATPVEKDIGWIDVFERPVEGREYVLAADVAQGRGRDFSAAVVLDLETMAPVAEFHAKIDPTRYALQLHYLGRWYNSATLAVEDAGGHGDSVLIALRSRNEGRRAYPKLYTHRQFSRPDLPEHASYGFPMNTKTRPQVLGGLSRALMERAFPYLTPGCLSECSTFVHRDTNPSPRAQDGCNDDRVMALAVACELWRQLADHPNRVRSKAPTRQPRTRWARRAA